jgi:hypothetical protein
MVFVLFCWLIFILTLKVQYLFKIYKYIKFISMLRDFIWHTYDNVPFNQ